MTALLNDEVVPPMPPLSTAVIERVAEGVLLELQPEALIQPMPLDFADWAEHRLQGYKMVVSPASVGELGDRMGATDPVDYGDGITEILMEATHYDDLLAGGRRANMARATLLHEIGHGVLHVPVVRRRMATNSGLLGRGVLRSKLEAFRDPEWQAWALAACIAAPRKTILMTGTLDPGDLAEIYNISEKLMRLHLERLRLIEKEARPRKY